MAYETLVVWREPSDWWVVAPDDVMGLVLGYAGQHCTSSFECCNPGKPTAAWDRWKCSPDEVPTRVTQAFAQGESSPLKGAAATLREQILALWESHKVMVKGPA